MGNSELEISRPTTPSALAATLLSSFDDGSYLPDGLAVEVTPYWLFPHPNLRLERYYWGAAGPNRLRALSRKRAKEAAGGDREEMRRLMAEDPRAHFSQTDADKDPALCPLHDFSFSVALASENVDEETTRQTLGLGVRMPLRTGMPADQQEDVRRCFQGLLELQTYRAEWIDEWLWDAISEIELDLGEEETPEIREAVDRAQAAYRWSQDPQSADHPGEIEAAVAEEVSSGVGFDTVDERDLKADFWIKGFVVGWLARKGADPDEIEQAGALVLSAAGPALEALRNADRETLFEDDYEDDTGRSYADDREAWQDDCEDTLELRRGFAVDLAGGMSLVFDDWKMGRARPNTYGAWVTPAHLDQDWSSVWMLGHFGRDLQAPFPEFSLDAGWRGIYSWRRLGISAEIMHRFVVLQPQKSVQMRWAVGVDLRVLDGVWVSASIGMDGELPYTKDLPLLSMIQLEFDTGTDRVLAPDASEMGWLKRAVDPETGGDD